MKARIHWESRHHSGYFDVESFDLADPTPSFEEWCTTLSGKSVLSDGAALLVTPKCSIPMSAIVRIENMEC